jgi:uncharacterized protein (TIGR02246 family)
MPVTAGTPAEVIAEFAAAMRDGRVEEALALYEPDAVFIPQPGAQPVSGPDAIGAALAQFAALRPVLSADVRKVVRAGNVATVHNTWQLTGTSPDGTPVQMGGTSADVMRLRPDGTWGILIDDPWGVPAPGQPG